MEPIIQFHGYTLTYQLGKYFSGTSRHDWLREHLLHNGFEVKGHSVLPLEWDGTGQHHVNDKPLLGLLRRKTFWHENEFCLDYAYLLGIPGVTVTRSTEDHTSLLDIPWIKGTKSIGDGVFHITTITTIGSICFGTYNPFDESKIEPYVRRVKDICDRLE